MWELACPAADNSDLVFHQAIRALGLESRHLDADEIIWLLIGSAQ
jgi:hypothetical protein